MTLFQFAVIWNPTEKQHEDGDRAKVIVEVTTVIAADANAALLHAGRAIPDAYLDQLDQCEVVVRPF